MNDIGDTQHLSNAKWGIRCQMVSGSGFGSGSWNPPPTLWIHHPNALSIANGIRSRNPVDFLRSTAECKSLPKAKGELCSFVIPLETIGFPGFGQGVAPLEKLSFLRFGKGYP